MPRGPLRFGLIGAGSVARRFHVPGWMSIPEAAIIAILESIYRSASLGREVEVGPYP
jgi:predicted dehydrogenase